MSVTEVSTLSLRDILASASARTLALPDFQRPYVWDDAQVGSLIATVLKGWPCGSLLVMAGRPERFDVSPISVGGEPFGEGSAIGLVILDGQQRIISLVRAFGGKKDERWVISLDALRSVDPELSGSISEDDLEDAITVVTEQHDVVSDQDLLTRGLLPVSTLLGGPRFFSLCASSGIYGDYAKALFRASIGGAASYVVPTAFLAPDTEPAIVARIFERINRTGTSLGTFDLMVARVFDDDWNLRSAWDDLPEEFDDLIAFLDGDGLPVLRVVGALQHRPNIRQGAVINLPREAIIESWSEAVRWSHAAASMLRDRYGCPSRSYLPSDVMFQGLASMLRRDSDQRQVDKWFWQTAFGTRYEVASNTRVLRDVETVSAGSFGLDDPWFNGDQERLIDATRQKRSAIWRALRCALVANEAMDIHTGDPLTESIFIPLRRASGSSPALDFVLDDGGENPRRRHAIEENETDTLHEKALLSQFLTRDIADATDVQQRALMRIELLNEFLKSRADFEITA